MFKVCGLVYLKGKVGVEEEGDGGGRVAVFPGMLHEASEDDAKGEEEAEGDVHEPTMHHQVIPHCTTRVKPINTYSYTSTTTTIHHLHVSIMRLMHFACPWCPFSLLIDCPPPPTNIHNTHTHTHTPLL